MRTGAGARFFLQKQERGFLLVKWIKVEYSMPVRDGKV
jgi:hypothetical protein